MSLGSGDAYIYAKNENINFRVKNTAGIYFYTDILKLINSIVQQGHVTDGTNLNNIIQPGMYTLSGTQYTNKPFNYGLLLTLNTGYSYVAQIGLGSDGSFLHRFKNENHIWTSWYQHTTTKK